MGNGLAGIRAAVGHKPVSVFEFFLFGNQPDSPEAGCQLAVRRALNVRERHEMLFGNHENMHRRLGVNVAESVNIFILIDFAGRDLAGPLAIF